MKIKHEKGSSLIEMIVGLSLLVFLVLSFVISFNYFIRTSFLGTKTTQSYFLAEEGIEALKSMRNNSWNIFINPLLPGQNYYLYFNGSNWESTTSPSTVDVIFTRKFTVENIYRDVNGDISISGTLDSGTKKINVSVSYMVKDTVLTKNLSTIITNIFEN